MVTSLVLRNIALTKTLKMKLECFRNNPNALPYGKIYFPKRHCDCGSLDKIITGIFKFLLSKSALKNMIDMSKGRTRF